MHYPRDLACCIPTRAGQPSVQKITNITFREDGMSKHVAGRSIACRKSAAFLVAAFAAAAAPASAQAGDPIKIGFSLALTGPLAPNGKQALLGAKIWEEEINAKGGLLGRKVELVNYDDQSNPANIPASTPSCSTSTRSICQRALRHISLRQRCRWSCKRQAADRLFGLDANKELRYEIFLDDFCRAETESGVHRRLFPSRDAAEAQAGNHRARRRGRRILAQCCEGARENAKTFDFTIVYDKSFPPGTTDSSTSFAR